jgi:hypothetical protein
MGIKTISAMAVGLALTSGLAFADVNYENESPNENLVGSGLTIGVGAVSGSSGGGYNVSIEGRLNRYFKLGAQVFSVRSGDSYDALNFEYKLPSDIAESHYLNPRSVTPRFNDISLFAQAGYPFDVGVTTYRPFVGVGFSQLRTPDIELEIVPDGESSGGGCGSGSSSTGSDETSIASSSDNDCLVLSFDTMNTMKIDTGIDIAWSGAHMLTLGFVSYMVDDSWEDLEIGDDASSTYCRYEYRPGNVGFTMGIYEKDQMGQPRVDMGIRFNF